jgi:transposase
VPALPAWLTDPLWNQFAALLPPGHVTHPLGCHRQRISDRVVFDKLLQVLVFGCAYQRIADTTCSERTLRRRRDEWLAAGVTEQLEHIARDAYDRMLGLPLGQPTPATPMNLLPEALSLDPPKRRELDGIAAGQRAI